MCGLKRALLKNSIIESSIRGSPGLIPNGEQGQEGSSYLCFLVEQCTFVYTEVYVYVTFSFTILFFFFLAFLCVVHTP